MSAREKTLLTSLPVLAPVLYDPDFRVLVAATRAIGKSIVESDLATVSLYARSDSLDGLCVQAAVRLADERLYCPIRGFTNEKYQLDQLRKIGLRKLGAS